MDFLEVTIDRELKYKYLKWWAPPTFKFDAHSSRACCTTCVARRQQQPGMHVSCVSCSSVASYVWRQSLQSCPQLLSNTPAASCRAAPALLVFAVLLLGAIVGLTWGIVEAHTTTTKSTVRSQLLQLLQSAAWCWVVSQLFQHSLLAAQWLRVGLLSSNKHIASVESRRRTCWFAALHQRQWESQHLGLLLHLQRPQLKALPRLRRHKRKLPRGM